MKLFELKSTTQYDMKFVSTNLVIAKFEVNGKKIAVDFALGGENKDVWMVDFVSDGMVGLTGGGDAMTILSTVIEITKQFINKVQPSRIAFSGNKDETSRIKLYKRLLNMLEKGGWKTRTQEVSGVGDLFIAER